MIKIPAIYLPAFWRNTTAYERERGCIGIGLTLESGETVRFRLDAINARHLSETITEYLPTLKSSG